MKTLILCFSLVLTGCGPRQLAVLTNSSLNDTTRPIKLYLSERDLTGNQAQYEVASLIDTLAPRLSGDKVVWLQYQKGRASLQHSYQNPFIIVSDSTEADLVATIRISMMDYMKKKDLRSTSEDRGSYFLGILRPGGNELRGVFGADCEIVAVQTGSVVHDFSFGGLSTEKLNRRQAFKSATERSIEIFIKELFRE